MSKTYWTAEYKPLIEKQLKEVGFNKNDSFYKNVIKLFKAQNTCYNKLANGYSWESLVQTNSYIRLLEQLNKMNKLGVSYNYNEALYWNEWQVFCNKSQFVPLMDIGDLLC